MTRWGAVFLLVAAGCGENPVTGHRHRVHWTTSSGVINQPHVEDLTVGAWTDEGFVPGVVTALEDGGFSWNGAPAGEYLVGVDDGQTWLSTSARELDLDQLARFGAPGEIISGSSTVRLVTDGVLPPFPVTDTVLFSPDTTSQIASFNMETRARFSGFPVEGTERVQSWVWERGIVDSIGDGSASVVSIHEWATFSGLPAGDELPIQFLQDNQLMVTGQLPGEEVMDLADQLSVARRGFTASMGLLVSPRIADRPHRLIRGAPSPGSMTFTWPSTLPREIGVRFFTHNPFSEAQWSTQWSWSIDVLGGADEPTGIASIVMASAQAPTSFLLTITPPHGLTIDGVDANVKGRFLSRSPTIAWSPPYRGAPSGYSVEYVDDAQVTLRRLLTTSTSVHLPPDFVLGRGAIRVQAIRSVDLSWEPHPPLDLPLEFTSAATISAKWDAPP